MEKKIDIKSFENNLVELEKIVEKLEKEGVDLSISLEEFEKGVHLYKICRETLDGAQKKVNELTDLLNEKEVLLDD